MEKMAKRLDLRTWLSYHICVVIFLYLNGTSKMDNGHPDIRHTENISFYDEKVSSCDAVSMLDKR